MFTVETMLTCALIVLGRVIDVTLGTVRTIMVVRGYRRWACVLGFFEVLVWIFVVTRVIHGLAENPLFAVSYALGFAAGNFVGITLDNRLGFGQQVVQVFSRRGGELATEMRTKGVRMTCFQGAGRDGPTSMLMIVADRGLIPGLIKEARRLDPECYYSVEDVRTSASSGTGHVASGWREIMKKK
jgi:uncharacterized protein YebE (UPF0316 family)